MKDFKIIELMELFDEGEVTTADQMDRPQKALDREMFQDASERFSQAQGGRTGYKLAGEVKDGKELPKNIRLTAPGGKFRFDTQAGGKNFTKIFSKDTDLEDVVKFRNKKLKEFGIEEGKFKKSANPKRGKYVGVKGQKHIKFNGVTYEVKVQRKKGGKDISEKPFYTSDLDEAIKVRDERVLKSPPKVEKGVVKPDRKKIQEKINRRRFIQKTKEGRTNIAYKPPKGYQVHHLLPLSIASPDTKTRDLAVIDAQMNKEMAQFDKPIKDLTEEAFTLDFNGDRKNALKRLNEINKELNGIVKKAVKKLGPEYKGLIGFNEIIPVFDSNGVAVDINFKPVGVDFTKSIAKNINVPEKVKNISTPELKKLVSEAPTTEVEKLLASFSANPKCRASFGKKNGGRINYAKGPAGLSECAISGRNRLEKVIKGGVQLGNQEGILAKQILRAGRSLGSAFTLSGLFGPAAIAFTAAAEAGIVGYDMLTTGKTFKEAVGDSLLNYALGEKTKIDPNKELFKRFGRKDKQGNFLIKGMTDDKLLNIAKVFDQSNQLNTILKQQLKTADLEKLVEAERAQPKNQFVGPDDEMLQTDEAIRREQDLKDSRQELENILKDYRTPLPVDTGGFGGLSKEDAILADMASGTFEQSQKDLADATKAAEIQKLESSGPVFMGKVFPKFEESRQEKLLNLKAVDNPAAAFAIESYENPDLNRFTPMRPLGLAGGGIAKLAGIDEGPQTESLNPDSQGLSGLLKRAKKA